ncbi:MAG: hypothetical protein E6I59_15180 [Chloroflexi bacterium]|nr:MAG: hypothetical protein E6I59_15180 [Chloroflexota bacterium]
MQSSWDFERLSEACNKAGCILCRLTGETTRRYLETWKDEMFTDFNERAKLRSSRGFCNTHTWQLVQMGASLPLAQAYRDIITDEIEQLEKDGGRRRQRWFHPKNGEELPDSSFYTLFLSSHGLCLQHFHLSCTLKPLAASETWLPLLRQAQLAIMQRLEAQLSELIRKHDYRYKDEKRGAEMTSWQRAAGLVSGEEGSIT